VHHIEQQRKMESRMAEMQKWEGLATCRWCRPRFQQPFDQHRGNVHLAQMEPGNIERQAHATKRFWKVRGWPRIWLARCWRMRERDRFQCVRFPERCAAQNGKNAGFRRGWPARIELRLEENLPALLGDDTKSAGGAQPRHQSAGSHQASGWSN
jgi:hypothetical protein